MFFGKSCGFKLNQGDVLLFFSNWHRVCFIQAIRQTFMTLSKFNKLSIEEQQKAVLINGVFLGERKDPPLRMMLYDMGSFYVEVFFLSRYNKVAWFNAFQSTKKLDPYLQKIDVHSLLQEALS
jgi:hypothetical protein